MAQDLNCQPCQDPNRAQDKAYQQNYTRVLLPLAAMTFVIAYVGAMLLPGIPAIQNYFKVSAPLASWISTAYLIVGAAIAPLIGKLADFHSKKTMILIVLTCYIVGVGIAGFATSIYILLFARVIQGVGYVMVPLAFAVICDYFPKEKIASAQGLVGAMSIVGVVIGFIGGALILQDLGWRWAFYSAFILSAIIFVVIIKVVKKGPAYASGKLDYAGVGLLSIGVVLLLLYLTEGSTLGWVSLESLALLIPGIILFGCFFAYENKITNSIIPKSIMRIRNVLVADTISLLPSVALYMCLFSAIYLAELPKPNGLGLDILSTGLTLLPAGIITLIVTPLISKLLTKSGPKPSLMLGCILMIFAFIALIVGKSSIVGLAVVTTLAFAAQIIAIIASTNMLSIALPSDSNAVGQGIYQMLKSFGQSVGPVITTALMAAFTVPLIVNVEGHSVVAGNLPSATAFNIIAVVGIVFMAVAIVVSLATKNYTFKDHSQESK